MLSFEKKIFEQFKNKEFLYLCGGSFLFFNFKIVFIYLNDLLNLMSITNAYLICHIFLFVFSWFYHSLISFSKKHKKSFLKFLKTSWALKIFDYFLVVFLSIFFFTNSILSIITSSIIIFLLRFLIFRNYVFK